MAEQPAALRLVAAQPSASADQDATGSADAAETPAAAAAAETPLSPVRRFFVTLIALVADRHLHVRQPGRLRPDEHQADARLFDDRPRRLHDDARRRGRGPGRHDRRWRDGRHCRRAVLRHDLPVHEPRRVRHRRLPPQLDAQRRDQRLRRPDRPQPAHGRVAHADPGQPDRPAAAGRLLAEAAGAAVAVRGWRPAADVRPGGRGDQHGHFAGVLPARRQDDVHGSRSPIPACPSQLGFLPGAYVLASPCRSCFTACCRTSSPPGPSTPPRGCSDDDGRRHSPTQPPLGESTASRSCSICAMRDPTCRPDTRTSWRRSPRLAPTRTCWPTASAA